MVPLIGPRTPQQFEDALPALDVKLNDDQLGRLDQAGAWNWLAEAVEYELQVGSGSRPAASLVSTDAVRLFVDTTNPRCSRAGGPGR